MTDQFGEESTSDAEELFSESEDDLGSLESAVTFDAIVVSSDWTTDTLLSQIKRGQIDMDPIFQRRDAWDRKKKSRFIESLIVGLPVPQIVLAERKTKNVSGFVVLDGKQRLLTIKQFSEGKFKLTGLELRSDLNKKSVEDLPSEDRFSFETQTVRTMVIRNWQEDSFLYLIFHRLNTGNVPLSPQELRQALYPGGFVEFANDYTSKETLFSSLFSAKSSTPDFRMRDVELLVRYYAFALNLEGYSGNLKALLDSTCVKLNAVWDKDRETLQPLADECAAAIRRTREIFGAQAFRRWNGEEFETPFNRAVFDIMTYYLRHESVRDAASGHAQEIVNAFKGLCEDPDFYLSITSTTKSREATAKRLIRWGNVLSNVIDAPVLQPPITMD